MIFFKSLKLNMIHKFLLVACLCLQINIAYAQNAQSNNDTIMPMSLLDNRAQNTQQADQSNNIQAQQQNLHQQDSSGAPSQVAEKTGIIASATLTEGGATITKGMVWRVYSTDLGPDQKLKLLAMSKDGVTHFDLNPGSYLLLGSFGRVQVMRRINIIRGQDVEEKFVINAGALKLDANLPEGQINKKYLRFSIYKQNEEDDDEQILVMDNIKPGELVRLEAGDYDIVSSYGTENATVRFNMTVEAGQIIDITIPHRAAQITLKLVRQEGGEALANTSWSILNDSGDIVRESSDPYVQLVLMEGDYVAIAKNQDQIFQKNFSVQTGKDQVIDVVANAQNQTDINSSDD